MRICRTLSYISNLYNRLKARLALIVPVGEERWRTYIDSSNYRQLTFGKEVLVTSDEENPVVRWGTNSVQDPLSIRFDL